MANSSKGFRGGPMPLRGNVIITGMNYTLYNFRVTKEEFNRTSAEAVNKAGAFFWIRFINYTGRTCHSLADLRRLGHPYAHFAGKTGKLPGHSNWWDIHGQSGEMAKTRFQNRASAFEASTRVGPVQIVNLSYEAGFRPGGTDHSTYVLSGTKFMRARPAPGLTALKHFDSMKRIIIQTMGRGQMKAFGRFKKNTGRVA